MKLVEASANGEAFSIDEHLKLGESRIHSKLFRHDPENEMFTLTKKHSDKIHDFLILLCVCQAAIPENENGKVKYNSSSPDEEALLNGALKFQYE